MEDQHPDSLRASEAQTRYRRALERIDGYWLADAPAQVILDHVKFIARHALWPEQFPYDNNVEKP